MKIENIVIGETYKLKQVEKRKNPDWTGEGIHEVKVIIVDEDDHTVFVRTSHCPDFWIPAQWLKRNKS